MSIHGIVADVLLGLAAAVVLVSSAGILVMRDAYQRLHYVAPIAVVALSPVTILTLRERAFFAIPEQHPVLAGRLVARSATSGGKASTWPSWRTRSSSSMLIAGEVPELRAATANNPPGSAGVPTATAASLSDMRNTLSAMQRGWQQGRSQTQPDTEGNGIDGD